MPKLVWLVSLLPLAGFLISLLLGRSIKFAERPIAAVAMFDRYVVDGVVKLTGWIVYGASILLRAVQTGYWQNYALLFTFGLLVAALLFDLHAIPTVIRSLAGSAPPQP